MTMTPYYELLTGAAGCGKSWTIRQRLLENPKYGLLTATTGIAAINLDTTTVNAAFGYFDTQSLRDSYIKGWLHRAMLKPLKAGMEGFVISEFSMLDGDQLDIIVDTLEHLQENVFPERQLRLILEGDMGQLGVVKGKWIFNSQSWPKFEANTIKLTKNWRAIGDDIFSEFLNRYRLGQGASAVDLLREHSSDNGGPVRMADLFVDRIDSGFAGTTILGTNAETQRYNATVMLGLKGRAFTVKSERFGKQQSQWGLNIRTKEYGIPPSMQLKVGCYVVLKSNKYTDEMGPADKQIVHANGDCGNVVDFGEDAGGGLGAKSIFVKLIRNDEVVEVKPITRYAMANDEPKQPLPDNYKAEKDGRLGKWRVGEITFFPLKVAYASTVHSSQSLTLDRVQLDLRQQFMEFPAICYVGLSRCRSLAGLRIVGTPDLLSKRCKIDPRVARFL